jgi:hypothetical protein
LVIAALTEISKWIVTMSARQLAAAAWKLVVPSGSRAMSDCAMVLREMHKPTLAERRVFILSHAFRSNKDIPEWVSKTQVKRAYDVFRIELNSFVAAVFYLALLGIVSNERHKHIIHIHQADPQYKYNNLD